MERLIDIEDKLIEIVECEMHHDICDINTHELGEVIDMIKDIEEAIHYCAKTKKIAHELGNMHEVYTGHKTSLETIHGHAEMTKTTMTSN